MRTIGLGIQNFETIRKNDLFYVDKTWFIPVWYRKHDDITLITRPRRFGKTLTIDMLDCFFSITHAGKEDLFKGLAVSWDQEVMELQGTFPVIRISFSSVKADSFKGFLVAIAGRIARLLDHFQYLLDDGILKEDEEKVFRTMDRMVPEIPDSDKDPDQYLQYLYMLTHILQGLSRWLYRRHGKKVYIFMDEYDTPVHSAFLHHYYDDMIGIMRELFAETFKENEYLDRAVITGITRIAKESLFSGMNNLAVCSVIAGGYDSAFGFTRPEMEEILQEYCLTDQKDLIRSWYDGFSIGKEKEIYNPWSVLNYLSARPDTPEDYWAQSGGTELADHLLRRGGPALKKGFETLLDGGGIEKRIREDLTFPRLERDENAVWSLLIATGYLKPAKDTPTGRNDRMPIVLTNHESLTCLSDMVAGWFEGCSGNYMENFADALLAGDLPEMNEQLQQTVLNCMSAFDSGLAPAKTGTQPESFFHALTLGMLTCLSGDYRVRSNRESGLGRFDICLTPRKRIASQTAYILEFKVFNKSEGDQTLEDTARRALDQIDEKKYDTEFLDVGFLPNEIRKYGIAFRGKEVLILRH